MRKSLLVGPIAVLAMASHDLHAQTRNLTGRVVGTDGSGLPGVSVVVKGGTQGTSTDAEGRYSLTAPESATTLVFSFIGYETKEAAIAGQSSVNVTLNAKTTDIDEVVVIGYGSGQNRRELTGSIATVSGAVVAQKPVQSFEQALQGQAPGLNITTPNGVLNNPPVVRIRGVNSISLSSDPLYIIDGVPAFSGNQSSVGSVPNNPLSNLNPNDIESVEVLKDAAAGAIYGSRAAGGVIQITTKKGRRGQSRVALDSWVGWSRPIRLYDVLNADQYMEIKNEAVRNLNVSRENARRPGDPPITPAVEGFRPSFDANGNRVDTDWYDYIYRTGFSHSNNVSFSGGTEKTTFFSSVGYTGQEGMIVRNKFSRLSTRLNIDHRVYKTVTAGLRVSYANSNNSSPNTGSTGEGTAQTTFSTGGLGRLPLALPPNVASRNPNGSPNLNAAGLGSGANLNPLTGAALPINFYNPIYDLDNNYFTSQSNEIQGGVFLNWEVLSGLNFRTNYGINNLAFEDRLFWGALAGDGQSVNGQASNFYRTNKRWNWANTLQYDKTFGTNHTVSVLLGNEQQRTQIDRWGAQRQGIADDFFRTFEGSFTNIAPSGNFQSENYLVSFFGRVNYDFGKKYLASFNIRRDGYSAWAQKYGNFYGTSLGYIVSEEGFWQNSPLAKVVNFLKFTGSYGEVGNSNGIEDFVSLGTYGPGLYGEAATFYFSRPANRNLTWETSKKSDVGVNFGLFEDKVTGNFAYYRNLIDGLILLAPTAPSRGIPNGSLGPNDFLGANAVAGNIGEMRNTGIELNLSYNAIQGKDFSWTVSGNLTTQKNRVLKLVTEGQRIGTATQLETVNFTEVGRSVGELRVVESVGINPANGRRMFRKANGTIVQYEHLGAGWTDMEGNSTSQPTQQDDGVYFGPVLPKWFGGLDNTFRYKGFDLGLFMQYSGGNYIYNGTRAGLHDQRFWNNEVDILNRWQQPGDNAEWPRVVYTDNVSNGSAFPISTNVDRGDFVRLRNVALGYTLPQAAIGKLRMSNARVYVQVQNAALLTRYDGIDPEISSNNGVTSNTGAGVDRNSVGQARTFTAGINVGF